MIHEKTERRWEVSIPADESGDRPKVLVNSIDGDPKSVKVTVMGHGSVIVSAHDMVELLKRVAAHTSGIPNDLAG